VHCHYSSRLWRHIKDWISLNDVQPLEWQGLSIKEWWSILMDGGIPNRKAMSSLAMLVMSELWAEQNARVFRNKFAPPFVVLDKIKTEARLWVLAGAKHLGNLVSGE
jgi:hypothetical protein